MLAGSDLPIDLSAMPQDTIRSDTSRNLRYPFKDYSGNPWEQEATSPLFLNRPSNIVSSVKYDAEKNEYIIYEKGR